MNLFKSEKMASFIEEAKRFFVPRKILEYSNKRLFQSKHVAILIPTFKPDIETFALIKSILKLYPGILLVVIDDCTPPATNGVDTIGYIKKLSEENKNLVCLRTPKNMLKAGALNYGIEHLLKLPKEIDVVFTFDDDVIINKHTLPFMVSALYSEEKVGAVCSQVKIANKDKNMLTRLQGLEYHNFNITKIADNGFLKGPLVMQGMMTAIRMKALIDVEGYTHGHLIEDYDMTVRLKDKGWSVKITQKAFAWTSVPENVEDLWKQRVRWTNGGLFILSKFWRKFPVVYQDVVGHALFISLFLLIILSFIFTNKLHQSSLLVLILLILALFNFVMSFIFTVVTMKLYPQRDTKDWIIKLTILPEFVYSILLSLILLGSYSFFIYNLLTRKLVNRNVWFDKFHKVMLLIFSKVGFSSTWGTR